MTKYRLKNSTTQVGFGGKLRGREAAQIVLAEAADQLFDIKSTEVELDKEQSPQLVCLTGVGMGKSAFLAHGLESHRQFCKNPELQKLLHEDAKPLNMLISFNGNTTYEVAEGSQAQILLCRRMLRNALGITWEEALEFKLSVELTAAKCINGIVRYHRKINGMKKTQKVFVFVGVDEINKIAIRNQVILPELAQALRTLRNLCDVFVPSLITGTHAHDMHFRLLGSGISAIAVNLVPLNKSQYDQILNEDVGLSEKYRNDPRINKLIISSFPILRPLGQAIARLPVEYDSSAVRDAVMEVNTYFLLKRPTLKAIEVERVITAVISGEVLFFDNTADPLVEGSVHSWDSLQNDGTIQLIPITVDDDINCMQVSVPLVLLQRWLVVFPGEVTSMADELIKLANASDADSFELFAARFVATKLALMWKDGKREFTMKDVFPSALITKDLEKRRFQYVSAQPLPSCDVIKTLKLESSRFPEKELSTDIITENMQHLLKGGFIVNAPGALMDVLAMLKTIKENDVSWKPALLAILPKKTDGNTGLSKHLVDSDLSKALKAVAALPSLHDTDFNLEFNQLQAPEQNKAQLQRDLTVVHFSNRELSIKDKNAPPGKKINLSHDNKVELFLKHRSGSVIVEKHSFPRIVGPVLSNLSTRRTFSTLQTGYRWTMLGVRRLLK